MAAPTSCRRLAADIVDHAGPEGACADLAGHQVGTVEAEGRGVRQDLALLLQRVVGVGILVHALVRREEARLRHPEFMRQRRLQELDEGARGLGVLGDGDQRAGTEHRLAEIGLGRQRPGSRRSRHPRRASVPSGKKDGMNDAWRCM